MSVARVGLIGLGRMGCTIDDEIYGYPAVALPYSVAASCQASERLELVAGCDLEHTKRENFTARYGCEAVYDDYRRMIEQEVPDLVAVCTRAVNHAELAVGVAELGVKAIFCEKAMACSMAEADAILEAVGSRGIPFNTGVLRRHDARYEQLREIVLSGDIGKPQAAVHFASASLLHGHIHSIDTLLYLLGDPRITRVRGELRLPAGKDFVDGKLDIDPQAVYQLETDNGVFCTSVPGGSWEFEVMASGGSVRSYANGQDRGWRRAVQLTERHSTTEAVPLAPTAAASATMRVLEDLVDCLETGQAPREGVERAHHATEACLAVAESHRQGGAWVELPIPDRELYVFHV